jgi:hypothetical protein
VPTTKSTPRRANDRGPALGIEVQVQSKPTRSKRRSDVLYTVEDNDNQTAAYIAYCLNYSAPTVRRDLTWLAQNGYVTVTYKVKGGYGIRWPENGQRRHKSPVPDEDRRPRLVPQRDRPEVGPRRTVPRDHARPVLRPVPGPVGPDRHRPHRETMRERLAPSRRYFEGWTLAELEGAAADIAAWRAGLTDTSPLPADARAPADTRRRRPLGLHHPQPRRPRRPEPRTPQRGAPPVHARRTRRARPRTRPRQRTARDLRRGDGAADERVDRRRTPRHRTRREARGPRATPVLGWGGDAVPEDLAPAGAVDAAGARGGRSAAAPVGHAAPVPRE